MFGIESPLFVIIGLSFGSVLVGLVCGFVIGRLYTLANEPKRLQKYREETLAALMTLVESTEQLNVEVDDHNNELANAKKDLSGIDVSSAGEVGELQHTIVENIARVIESNRKLENDLVVTRYKLESQAQELDRTRKEARTDGLCEIGNRKAFDETLNFMVSRNKKSGESFGLMLIDIDHFKRINDTFGHTAGDEVLTSIGEVLKKCVRPEDVVCRLGGDEFAIMLEGLTDSSAEKVGARIRSTIELHDFNVGEGDMSTVVTMSMGLAVIRASDDCQEIYKRSDVALYRSKENGRNRLYTIIDDERAAVQLAQEAANIAKEVSEKISGGSGDCEESELESSYEKFKASISE